MKRILLILTGGTICSFAAKEGKNDVDSTKAAPILEDMLRKSDSPYREVEFDIVKPLDTLSENMTLKKWSDWIQFLKTVEFDRYAGAIILHGTDTLAYSAALMELLLRDTGIPIMMVSAQYTLANPDSNGYPNFEMAVTLIAEGIGPGVYVPYQNSDKRMFLHRGRALRQCENYSMDFFSKEMLYVDGFTRETLAFNRKNECRKDNGTEIKAKDERLNLYRDLLEKLEEITSRVLYIQPYVGIDYEVFDLSHVDAVLHGLYHAGTACVDSETYSARDFFVKCKENGIPVFISPSDDNYAYSSTTELLNAGALPVNGMTNEMTYVKLLLGMELVSKGFLKKEEVFDFLNKDICGEHIY